MASSSCSSEIIYQITTQLFDIYQALSEEQQGYPEIPLIHAGSLLLIEIEKELAALLKYADLNKFVKNFEGNKISRTIQDVALIDKSELPIIEIVLANEITFSFYVNLARSKMLEYTDEGRYFLGEEIDADYKDSHEFHILRPIDYLRIILKSDKELNNTFLRWITEIWEYHQQTTDQIKEFKETVEKWKSRSK
jgi:hypothetical protein